MPQRIEHKNSPTPPAPEPRRHSDAQIAGSIAQSVQLAILIDSRATSSPDISRTSPPTTGPGTVPVIVLADGVIAGASNAGFGRGESGRTDRVPAEAGNHGD